MWQILLRHLPKLNTLSGALYVDPKNIVGIVNYEDKIADILLSNGNKIRMHDKEAISNFMIRLLQHKE